MPPIPSIKSAPGRPVIERRQNSTTSWNAIARPSCLAAICGESGALNRHGEICSTSASSAGRPNASKQGGRIAAVPGAGVKSADDRLDRRDRAAGCLHVPDQPRGDEGLAYVGPGRGDEERCHCTGVAQVVAALRTCERTSSASRSISSSGCCAVKVRRRRAVPAGTVGGLMATTRKPSSASILDASSAVPASPSTTGTIGLAGSGSPARRAKALAFARGSAA